MSLTRRNRCILGGLGASIAFVLVAAVGCSASAARKAARTEVPPPAPPAVAAAREEFLRGRSAALAGDFQCAEEAFSRALELVRPSRGEPPTDPETVGFSFELYERILRYEA